MLLVSWNVAGRVKRLVEQAERLLSLHADVICLQEVTRSTLPRWRELLNDAGYLGVEHGDLDSGRSRPLAVLTACREPIVPVTGWDKAELALIRGLEPYGFRDAYRLTHGYEIRELSWEWPRWKGGYRLDHLIVSASISVQNCSYEHQWREDGLSDHSALTAHLQIPSGSRCRAI
jgi:exonuclease III